MGFASKLKSMTSHASLQLIVALILILSLLWPAIWSEAQINRIALWTLRCAMQTCPIPVTSLSTRYTKHIEKSPELSSELLRLLAIIRLSNYDRNAAIELLANAVTKNPKNALAQFQLGKQLWQVGDIVLARKHWAAIGVLRILAEQAEARGLWAAKQRNLSLAESEFRKAIALDPTYAGGYYGLAGVLWSDKSRRKELVWAARRALYLDSTPSVQRGMTAARMHVAGGDLNAAKEDLQSVINLAPDFAPAYSMLGDICWRLGDLDAAQKYLEMALSLNPADYWATITLGHVWRDQGYWINAVEWYRRAGVLVPQAVQPHYELSRLFKEHQKWNKAIEELKLLIRLRPENVQYHLDLAEIYLRLHSVSNARKEYETVLALEPTNVLAKQKLELLSGK